ncbi:MAG: GtrA family protein [Candidatus Portnoybacteria bacterium]|nr:GtrA family protein [Candidatus Portnoybacteria bacterium]
MNSNLVKQFSRFLVIGFLNTAIDFTILNILMWWTGIYSGLSIILLNAISFSIAVFNSYFWNKYWTFKDKEKVEAKEFSQFILVTLIGLAINSGIIFGVTTLVSPMFGISPELWANLAKAAATGFSLIWNFAGYKMFVFKK